MDLLTVIMHELGHALGFQHAAPDDIMGATLAPGVRKLPKPDEPPGTSTSPRGPMSNAWADRVTQFFSDQMTTDEGFQAME